MEKNLDYIHALELAVEEKYGRNATLNPKNFWNEEKEKKYIEETKQVAKKEYASRDSKEKIEVDGILVTKHILQNKDNKTCSLCKKYSFNKKDDVYLKKFNACYKCYLCKIEDK